MVQLPLAKQAAKVSLVAKDKINKVDKTRRKIIKANQVDKTTKISKTRVKLVDRTRKADKPNRTRVRDRDKIKGKARIISKITAARFSKIISRRAAKAHRRVLVTKIKAAVKPKRVDNQLARASPTVKQAVNLRLVGKVKALKDNLVRANPAIKVAADQQGLRSTSRAKWKARTEPVKY